MLLLEKNDRMIELCQKALFYMGLSSYHFENGMIE